MALIKGKFLLDALNDMQQPASLHDIVDYMGYCCPGIWNYFGKEVKSALDIGVHYGYLHKTDNDFYAVYGINTNDKLGKVNQDDDDDIDLNNLAEEIKSSKCRVNEGKNQNDECIEGNHSFSSSPPLIKGKFLLDALNDMIQPASLESIITYMCFGCPTAWTFYLKELKKALEAAVRYGYIDKVGDDLYAVASCAFDDVNNEHLYDDPEEATASEEKAKKEEENKSKTRKSQPWSPSNEDSVLQLFPSSSKRPSPPTYSSKSCQELRCEQCHKPIKRRRVSPTKFSSKRNSTRTRSRSRSQRR
ncbi:uncharacterized protein LOC119639652 [Glossina fuscipes]|uniref:Uncharacterized protein LOC119639652 n=1 Tax=Glossina fuscipes TaxID=7396 RepID=A0A9C6DUY8_9MUSC|nr:uncharacterized protein LOC119639652 [Glossina fuscipes]